MNRNSKKNIKHTFPARLQLAFYLVVILAGVSSFGGELIQSTASIIAGSPAPVTAQTGAVVIVTDATIKSGSCLPDGALNRDQSVTVTVCLQNVGAKDTIDLQASLQPSGEFTSMVGQQSYGTLKAGGPAVCKTFTATPGVPCDGTFAATIKLQDGASDLGSTNLTFKLGGSRGTSSASAPASPTTSFSENFDGVVVPNLPPGWTTTAIAPACPGTVAPWFTEDDLFDSPPNAAAADGTNCTADIRLDSPQIAVTTSTAQLTFENNFNFENGADGAVLEIAIGAGAFQDILAAGGSFVAGGYTGTIPLMTTNPLATRQVWTGASETFITTTVNLPASANGQNIVLRWRVGTDSTAASVGQVIDTISITDVGGACTLTCPGNVNTSNTTNQCGAVVTYPPPTTSGVCGTVTCTPPSGSFFNVGTTTVTCSEPSPAMCTFTVTVNDTQLPTITCPANITRSNDPGQCSAVVNYPDPTVTDNCPGAFIVNCGPPPPDQSANSPAGTSSCLPPSGSTFPKGVTTVICCARDAALNLAGCSFTITVNDTQAPVLTCPLNITQAAPAGQCSATVTYSLPTVSENCGAAPTPTCNPPSGSSFPVGTTTVNCMATDQSANTGTCSFTVSVTGNQFSITCPANITATTGQAQCSASVNYPPPNVINNCSGTSSVSCSPPAGSFFPVGVTTVTCTATSGSNSVSCNFTITVSDGQPPNISCPGNIVRTTEGTQCSAAVEFPAPVASDACSSVTVRCSPASGSRFSAGTTTVTCTATDAGGNTATCSFTVTVRDTQPPVVTCPPNVVLAAAEGQCSANVPLSALTATATDACNGAVTAVGSRSDGLALTAPFPVGTTTVTFTATDASGNTGRCIQTVTVTGTGGAAQIEIMPSTVTLKTVKVVGVKKAKKRRARGNFMISNTGCAPITLTLKPIRRVTDQNRFRETDDSEFFSVFRAGADGKPTGEDLTGRQVTINPGTNNKQSFVVQFDPVIPSIANATSNLRTEDVLPDSFVSVLAFEGTDRTLTINASVEKKVKLIDPDDPQNGDPEVTLCRSGNEFIVRYHVFDANKADVRNVKYEFLDSSNNVVRTVDNVDLAGPIGERSLVNGQSFSVEQRFTGANDNQGVVRVRVTVFGSNTSFSATSSQINQNCSASLLRQRLLLEMTLRLPVSKLDSQEP
jgi:hypothetical protein